MSDVMAMPSAETIEAVALAVQREHYKAGGWAWGTTWPGERPRTGRWSCACGAGGDVQQGEQVTALHRQHVARVMAVAIRGGT